MNKNKKVVKLPETEVKEEVKVDMNAPATRQEVFDIMSQLTGNINQIADYLMQDVNALYSSHVFPFQMRLSVLEDIVVGKGIATQEEITKLVEEKIQKLKEQAQEIRDKENDTKEEEGVSDSDEIPTED